ncbi:MAG TPA: hypothetical protein VIL18_11520 [Longimicrobiales bacterium]
MRRLATVFALLALLAANLRWAEPYYNWDMLGYVGAAHRLAGASPVEAHRWTFDRAAEVVPPEQYAWLVEGSELGQTVAADPAAFTQQLPFYSVKPAYPLLIRALDALGLEPILASVWISRAAYAAIGLVILLWLWRFLSLGAALATAWAIMAVQVVLETGQLSTPDALSAVVVLSALCLVFEAHRFGTGLFLLLLSIAIRPDNLLWLMIVAGYVALQDRGARARAGVAAAAGVAAFVALFAWAGEPGWRALFHHAFVEPLPYPAAHAPSLGLGGYARVYLRETHPANLPPFVVLFALLGAWLLVSRLRRFGRGDPGVALLAAVGCFAAVHWLLYPDEDRLLVTGYLVVLVMLVRTLAEFAAGRAIRRTRRGPTPRALPIGRIPRLEALLGRTRVRPGP